MLKVIRGCTARRYGAKLSVEGYIALFAANLLFLFVFLHKKNARNGAGVGGIVPVFSLPYGGEVYSHPLKILHKEQR